MKSEKNIINQPEMKTKVFLNILEKMTNIESRPRSFNIQVIKVPIEENQSKEQILKTIKNTY